MEHRISFVVPGAPQGKGRARIVKVGGFSRMATPEKTVAYEGLVAWTAKEAMRDLPMFYGPMMVNMNIDCAIPASWSKRKQAQALNGDVMPTVKPDLDNVIKAILDGCNGVVWRDDVQVVSMIISKRYAASPRVMVAAVPMDAAAA